MSERRTAAQIRDDYRASFDELNRRLATTPLQRHVRFFNFGYVVVGEETPVGPKLSRAFPNPDSAQLLFQLVGDADLADLCTVEVGCGRGGNLGLLYETFGARPAAGIDLALPSLQFAATSTAMPGGFAQADAQDLPLRSAAVDFVLNVESAGCYPDIERFFRETSRVLRPGGMFFYADLIRRDLLDAYRRALGALGFDFVTDRDITPNVLASRERRADRERLALGEAGPAALAEWVGQSGSLLHQALAGGDWAYQLFRLERDDSPVNDARVLRPVEAAAAHESAAFWADVLHLEGPESD